MSQKEKIQQAIVEGVKRIEEAFAPFINATNIKIGRLEAAGLDPKNYYELENDEFVNYIEIRDLFVAQKEQTIADFNTEMDQRLAQIEQEAPSEEGGEFLQVALEVAWLVIESVYENGLKITIGDVEWDISRPLGGEGSVFAEARSAAFKALGIHEDSPLAKILLDPVNEFYGLPENVKRETDKALTDLKRETDKALTDIKSVADDALTDVKKATDKALTDARKTAEKAAEDVAKEVGRAIKKLPRIRIKIKF